MFMIATLILPTCGKRKPDTLTGATEVSQQVMEAKEEPGILSWMWDTVKDHPYYTAVGVAGFILVSYWGYKRYQLNSMIGDIPDGGGANGALPNPVQGQNIGEEVDHPEVVNFQQPAPSSDGF